MIWYGSHALHCWIGSWCHLAATRLSLGMFQLMKGFPSAEHDFLHLPAPPDPFHAIYRDILAPPKMGLNYPYVVDQEVLALGKLLSLSASFPLMAI